MLYPEPNVGHQRPIIFRNRALHLDLSEGDEEAFLDFGVQTQNAGRLPEVTGGSCERVHGLDVSGNLMQQMKSNKNANQPHRNGVNE